MTTSGSAQAGNSRRDGFAGQKIRALLSATWLAQACYAFVKLGVPDILAAGPLSAADIAAKASADPTAMHRLLRVLASAGMLRQTGAATFALNPVSELLRSDAPGAAHLMAIMHGEEVFRSFAEIVHTVRTGEPAFDKVYGTSFYRYLEENPAAAHTFTTAMGTQPVPPTLAECDLSGARTVVDVGGGQGSALAQLLIADPDLRGVLVELPSAVEQARANLAAQGVADRVEVVEGSFFDGVPAGHDVYLLSRVLHNWTDEHALDLLRTVRAAMTRPARLIVLEELLPDDDSPAGAGGVGDGSRQQAGSLTAGMVDLLMLVTLEGHDRTERDYRRLLVRAGFRVRAVHLSGRANSAGAIEAEPSPDWVGP